MTSYAALSKTTPQRPVLLVVTLSGLAKRADLDQLMETIQTRVNPAVQIMRITDLTHPEVVRSFNFNSFPAFVLVQQGKELWWHTGHIDNPEVFDQLAEQINTALFKNSNGSRL